MRKIIKQIKEKPEPQRHKISLVLSALMTVVIFVVWVTTLPNQLESTSKNSVAIESETGSSSPSAAIFSSFKKSVTTAGKNIAGVAGVLNDDESESTEEIYLDFLPQDVDFFLPN